MPTTASQTYSAGKLSPAYRPEEALEQNVKLDVSLTLARGTVLGEKLGINAVQTITITGTPTGGTLTISFRGVTSGAIAYNATAATVQTALEAMSTIGVGNVLVSGGPGPGTAWVLTFRNALSFQPITAMTTTDSLTGGSSPASAVAQTTTGTVGTKGTFSTYNPNNTDGTQFPKCILQYAASTDSSGNVTLTGEWLASPTAVPAYMAGYFRTEELVGMDANALTLMGGSLVSGTLYTGVVRI